MTNQIIYAPVAIPYEDDCDCDNLSRSEILYASKEFMENYQRIDHDHCLAFGDCPSVGEPVDSIILSNDKVVKTLEGESLTLPTGTWILGVRVTDEQVWKGIQDKTYTGFSLMGVSKKSGNRTTIEQLGKDWVATAVSIVKQPCVPKAKFIQWSENMEDTKIHAFIESIKSAIKNFEEPIEEPIEPEEEVVEEAEATKEEPVAEEVEATKSTEEEVVVVEYATKEDIEELKNMINSLKTEQEEEAIKSLTQTKDEEIATLKSEINELKKELANVGKSKTLKTDCGCNKKVTVKDYDDFEDRDIFGRKI